MKPVFVDTSALIAICNKRDAYHTQAIDIMSGLRRSARALATTSAVLLEFGNAFSPVHLKHAAIKMIDAIQLSPKWKCATVDASLFAKGFHRFNHYRDKAWGLVDCISMIVADDLGVAEIFTTDHHFEQAGFSILLK